jgi:integral membrane protein (TIGR00529 family)
MFSGLIGILLSIGVIILFTQRGWQLVWAMLTGSFIVAIFSGLAPVEWLRIIGVALRDSTTIYLTLIMITITSFGHLLRETGYLDGLIASLGEVFRDLRVLIAIIPALVGLLVVPGGAVFSAPLIEGIGNRLQMSRDRVASLNVIFRHLLFLAFPLYPGLLLASEISGINVYSLILFNLPVLILGLASVSSYFFRSYPASARPEEQKKPARRRYRKLIISLLPFILVLGLGIAFNLYFPLALSTGIVFCVVAGYPGHHKITSIKARAALVIPGINWSMALAMVGIMVFRNFIQASGVLDDLSVLLLDLGVPPLLLAIVFPLATGLIMANHTAAVGISLPLFLPLLPAGNAGVAYASMMFISSLAGYVASPFHLCLLLSAEYFKASLAAVIKKVAIANLILIALAVIQLLLYSA